jgi:hypothetical protein
VRLGVAAQEKPKVIPVDDFIRDELYPGYTQAFGTLPFVAGPVRPFSKADNASYWLRAPAAKAKPESAAQPSFDPVQYALRNVFKVPGA